MTNELTAIVSAPEKKNEGRWVQEQQGTAEKEGFRNVSQYWLPKTLTFDEGRQQLANLAAEREDNLIDARSIGFDIGSYGINVVIEDRPFTPTESAARQLCKWMGVPETLWVHYAKGNAEEREVLQHAFEVGQRKEFSKEKQLLFRTYKDGTLRAVLSDSYSIVNCDWYLQTLEELLPGGRLSHFNFSSADTIFGNVLIPDTIRQEDDSDYGGMISISNSEIGQRTVSQTPSIFRAICMNGCIWGQTEGTMMRQRHRGINLSDLKAAIRDNVTKQIPLLTTRTDDLLATRMMKAEANMSHIFAAIAKANNLSGKPVVDMASEWNQQSRERTLFGAIDAITRAAQSQDAATWNRMDILGGTLLNGGQKTWDNYNAIGKSMTDKEMQKVFGISA